MQDRSPKGSRGAGAPALSHLQRGLSQAPSGSSRSSIDLDPAALGSDGGAAQRRGQEPQATPSSVVTLSVFLQIPTVGSVHFRLPTCENTWYTTLRDHVLTRYLGIWIDWCAKFYTKFLQSSCCNILHFRVKNVPTSLSSGVNPMKNACTPEFP